MRFPVEKLAPSGGDIYCHLFENENTGLARNVFWSVTIDFKPIRYGDSEWDCSMNAEWITWPVRRWQDLDDKGLECDFGQGGVEASFYLSEHHVARHVTLALRRRKVNLFRVTMEVVVDFRGVYGDQSPGMRVRAESDVAFQHLIVVPGNLSPAPAGIEEVNRAVSDFLDLSTFEEPERDRSRYLFRPVLGR